MTKIERLRDFLIDKKLSIDEVIYRIRLIYNEFNMKQLNDILVTKPAKMENEQFFIQSFKVVTLATEKYIIEYILTINDKNNFIVEIKYIY